MKLSVTQISTVVLMREIYGISWNEIAFLLHGITGEKISGGALHTQITNIHPELRGKK